MRENHVKRCKTIVKRCKTSYFKAPPPPKSASTAPGFRGKRPRTYCSSSAPKQVSDTLRSNSSPPSPDTRSSNRPMAPLSLLKSMKSLFCRCSSHISLPILYSNKARTAVSWSSHLLTTLCLRSFKSFQAPGEPVDELRVDRREAVERASQLTSTGRASDWVLGSY